MLPKTVNRSTGLDISLAGAILASVSFLASNVSHIPATSPHIIRFFDKPPGTTYPAVMPQDAALLLLTDPSTASSTTGAGGITLPPVFGSVWMLLGFLGIGLVVLGPIWAYYNR